MKQHKFKNEANATTTIVVNGSVTVDGLDAEPYTLTETKAPNGYNLLDGSKTITVTVDNTAKITVENVAGIILVIGAGIVLVVRRRMSTDR